MLSNNRHRQKIQYIYIFIHLAVKASGKQSLTAHKSLTQKRLSIVQQADADIF